MKRQREHRLAFLELLMEPKITYFIIIFSRKWANNKNEYVLIGVVTGNPSGRCKERTLPDVYNFIGNNAVS